jgi:hypothetical protein
MKKSLVLLLFSVLSLCLLSACGGGANTPPPPPATHFSVTAPASATAGTAVSFMVTALDASNNPATTFSGTAHFTSTDALATLPANSMLTNGTGSFSATLKTVGSQTLTATDSAEPSIAGTSNSINVSTSAPTHFSVTAPASATPGTAFNFTVNALDAANNVATSYSGTVHFTSTDDQAMLPANSTLTNGTGTFSAILKTVGGRTITATDTLTASITGTSNVVTVFSGECTKLGQQCPPQFPPCCPGLVCAAASDRAFCEPASAASKEESRFSAACIMQMARESHTATLLSNGLVILTGGSDGTVSLATAELFNPASHTFAPAGDMADARASHTATLLTNGAVVVIGGRDASGHVLATAELFDPANINFAPTGSMNAGRESHTATLLSNGKVLIAGGDNGTESLATAELFDPTSGKFSSSGSMRSPRGFQTATLLRNGKVLVTGGRDGNRKVLATAELYDPMSGRFTPTGAMSTPRESHTATLLSDGNVLITGGDNGTESLATAELFDPASGSFAQTGSMYAPRGFHSATLRKDGTVLVAGGTSLTSIAEGNTRTEFLPQSTATAELFDPASDSFLPMGEMATPRARQTATPLPDGTVLLTGGVNDRILTAHIPNSRVLATAELFQ